MIVNNIDYKVKGYTGLWSVIDDRAGFVLLEHNYYGDETCYLMTRKDQKANSKEFKKKDGTKILRPFIIGKVYETYDDIDQCIQDEL